MRSELWGGAQRSTKRWTDRSSHPPGTGSLTAIISRARNPKLREVKRPAWEHTVSRGGTGTQIQACRAHGAQQLPGEQSPLLSAASPTLKQESQ